MGFPRNILALRKRIAAGLNTHIPTLSVVSPILRFGAFRRRCCIVGLMLCAAAQQH
jgi:hypothetical protein